MLMRLFVRMRTALVIDTSASSKAAVTPSSMPNSKNAITTDSNVRIVRTRLRQSPAQMSGKNFTRRLDRRVARARPCRRRAGAMRAPAARGSCVTMTMVLPCSRFSSCSSSRIDVGGFAVEVAGRLVADEQRRIATSARAIATRCCWPPESSPGLCFARSASPTSSSAAAHCACRSLRRQLRQQQRHLDVALGRQHGQQVVELEDEPDVPRAPLRELARATAVEPLAGHGDLAAIGPIEAADQVQQRRLAGAGRSHQREELALLDRRDRGRAAPRRAACRACSLRHPSSTRCWPSSTPQSASSAKERDAHAHLGQHAGVPARSRRAP